MLQGTLINISVQDTSLTALCFYWWWVPYSTRPQSTPSDQSELSAFVTRVQSGTGINRSDMNTLIITKTNDRYYLAIDFSLQLHFHAGVTSESLITSGSVVNQECGESWPLSDLCRLERRQSICWASARHFITGLLMTLWFAPSSRSTGFVPFAVWDVGAIRALCTPSLRAARRPSPPTREPAWGRKPCSPLNARILNGGSRRTAVSQTRSTGLYSCTGYNMYTFLWQQPTPMTSFSPSQHPNIQPRLLSL